MQNQPLEYRLKKDDHLCFVRIPKTGSTTFVSILDAHFPVEEICPILVADLPKTSPESLTKYRLFRDHIDYDVHQYLPHKPVYITMLRHPLDRAISYYEFCKRCPNINPFDQYLREEASKGLKEFITHPDPTIRIRTSNLQTRQIAAGLGSRHLSPLESSPTENQYADDQLLHLAKQHLKSFQFVGITEEFQRSILLLSYIFGWYPITDYQNLRVAAQKSKKDELDQETIEAILEINQLDLELYQDAQALFADAYAQMVAELSEKYGAIAEPANPPITELSAEPSAINSHVPLAAPLAERLQQHYADRYAEQRTAPPLKALDFNFFQAISGTGWHRRNGGRSGLIIKSTPFRWTGPGTHSTLDFPLSTSEALIIRIRIINAATPDILDSFQLYVNDDPIPLATCLRRNTLAVLQGSIPQTALASQHPFTRLTFQVSHTLSLQQVDPNGPDRRVVGLGVQSIQLFPASQCPPSQCLQPEGFADLFFPQADQPWQAVAQFLQSHLQPSEMVMAPLEFINLLSSQFHDYTQPFASNAAWVVIHKGYLTEIHSPSLQIALKAMVPVFANQVCVVFTSRSDLNRLPEQDPHLKAFHVAWQQQSLQKSQIRDAILAKIRRWLSPTH